VWVVAGQAVLDDGRVLEDKRAFLDGVAGGAQVVGSLGGFQCAGVGGVDVVA
jgi:hypothetical protein